MIFRFFNSLMPKEEKFVELFVAHSGKIVSAAEALGEMMADGAELETHFKRICQLEGEADAITRQTIQALHRSFITPFDREHIHGLITCMDDAIDGIEEVAQRADLYGIRVFNDDMRALAAGIVDGANLLARAMPLLHQVSRNAEAINKLCDSIGQHESAADKHLHDGLRSLFATERDPVVLITTKEMYQRLEKVTDRFDDVANVVETIVVEHV